MANINEKTLAIAAKLEGKLSLEGAELKLADDAYDSTLPENISAAQANDVHTHDKNFAHGFAYAAGEAAINALKDNPQLSQLSATTQVGIANVDVLVKREGSVTIPPAEKGGEATTKTVHGYASFRISAKSDAETKRIKTHIATLGEKAFG